MYDFLHGITHRSTGVHLVLGLNLQAPVRRNRLRAPPPRGDEWAAPASGSQKLTHMSIQKPIATSPLLRDNTVGPSRIPVLGSDLKLTNMDPDDSMKLTSLGSL